LLARVSDPDAKAGDLNVARQFLKDNGIEAIPVHGSPLGDLVRTLPDFSDADFDVSELKAN
jgi:Zn-dependent membrane protease YugP